MDRQRRRGRELTGRLTLLLTSPRVAPGLLARTAWTAIEEASEVFASDSEHPQALAIADAGVQVQVLDAESPAQRAIALLGVAADAQVLWISSPDGDPGLTDALARQVASSGQPPQVEVVIGSWDVPGGRLLDAVAVMDRLRSPGGCPWDAEQTHASLVPYLVEEAHEVIEAVEAGTPADLQEELGDLLLQVLFHARVAADDGEQGFDIDDVAGTLVAKLVRRHPHVFADVSAADAAAVEANWEQIKSAEKPEREHPLDGIPASMPDLARASKVISRLERAGHGPWLRRWLESRSDVGATLIAHLDASRRDGVDPSAALRAALRELHEELPTSPE